MLPDKLECPECGHGFMHQQSVEVFRREKEDADKGLQVTVEGLAAAVDTEVNGNPSRRRGAIAIWFECEMGCRNRLIISQHKGEERIYWE